MEMHIDRTRAGRLATAIAVAMTLAIGGCGSERESTVVTRTVTTIPPPAPPPAMTDIAFVDLRGEPTADPGKEKVVGTIVNRGDKPVSRLAIRVEGLDASGAVVTDVVTPPLDQPIAALGGRMRFEALLPRHAAVASYHAVAIAR